MINLPWQIESLRKTYFFPLESELTTTQLWKSIVQSDPSDRNEKHATRTITEHGIWHDHMLSVTFQPGRVDILLNAIMNVPGLPNAGLFIDLVDLFKDLKLTPSVVQASRIAFGAVLLVPEKSHQNCYETLGKLLSHVEINQNSNQFIYRINNPTQSTVIPNSFLNCISTWAALRVEFSTISPSSITDSYATRVELDINTDANTLLGKELDVESIFDEMILIGKQILVNGARP